MSSSSQDAIGVIFRESGSLNHLKGVNKLLFCEHENSNYLFTGGRDSMIKLWSQGNNEYRLLNNFENHVDWVNDMFYEKQHNILFSCSNDKTIQFWRLENEDFASKDYVKTSVSSRTLCEVHKDYVKCLSYSSDDKVLYSGGYDGLISYFPLDEYYKTNYIKVGSSNTIYSSKDNSILAIDTDPRSKLLLFSAYETQLVGFDIRKKNESFFLRGHKEKINGVKISFDLKIGISCSSDKTLKIWDLRMQRVLHNYEFHRDSIVTMKTNETMSKIVTGSKGGEVYLTDLNRLKFCKIDKSVDPVVSLDISSEALNMFASFGDEVREYNFKLVRDENTLAESKKAKSNFVVNKTQIAETQGIVTYSLKMSTNEITKYHIMKNKVYILAEDKLKNVYIYNVMKLKLIARFANSSLSRIVSVLDNFDTVLQKSWFSVDVKLGAITVLFQKGTVFNNTYNFDIDFIERILEKSNNLTTITPNLISDSSFVITATDQPLLAHHKSMAEGKGKDKEMNSSLSSSSFSRVSTQTGAKKVFSVTEKIETLGCFFLVSVFENFVQKILETQMKYFDTNFIDPKNAIISLVNVGGGIPKQIKDKKSIKIDNKFFIYSLKDTSLTVGPSIDVLDSNFELPEFLKEIIRLPTIQFKPIKGEKVDVILNNNLKELKVRNAKPNSTDNSDELEVQSSVTIHKLKDWLVNKNYLDVDHLKNLIAANKDAMKVNDSVKKLIDNFYANASENLHNSIDFVILDNIVIKNNELSLGEIKDIFFSRIRVITVYLKYATIESLIERGVIA